MAAITRVLWFVAAYVAWVFVWTLYRLGISRGLGSAAFLPFHTGILTFAGLLPLAIVLFLPASLLWERIVSVALHVGSAGELGQE